MTIDKEKFEELCVAFAVGALDKAGEKELFSLLHGADDEHRKVFTECSGISFLLNQSVIRAVPSLSVKMKMMYRIDGKRPPSESGIGRMLDTIARTAGFDNPRFGVAFSLLLLIVAAEIGGYAYVLYHELSLRGRSQESIDRSLIALQQEVRTLRAGRNRMEAVLTLLQSPSLRSGIMEGMNGSTTAGRIYWAPGNSTAVIAGVLLPAHQATSPVHCWATDATNTVWHLGLTNDTLGREGTIVITGFTAPPSGTRCTVSFSVGGSDADTTPTGTIVPAGIVTF